MPNYPNNLDDAVNTADVLKIKCKGTRLSGTSHQLNQSLNCYPGSHIHSPPPYNHNKLFEDKLRSMHKKGNFYLSHTLTLVDY